MISRKQFLNFFAFAGTGVLTLRADAASGGQCVRYVKNQKPSGYTWDKYYSLKKNGKAVVSSCDKKAIEGGKCVQWIAAKDIWTQLFTEDRGSTAKVGGVLVLDAFSKNSYGHVAIVKKIDGQALSVEHSNWEDIEQISGGTFTLDGKGSALYTTSKGVKWKTKYPVLGFVYKP